MRQSGGVARVSAKRLLKGPSEPSAPLRVLGVDPGTLRLGYGVVDLLPGGGLRYVECGVIAASPRASRYARLAEIAGSLRELCQEAAPKVMAMEEAFFGKNVQSTLALGEARGAAMVVAAQAGLRLAGYPPATVKKMVTGHGRATKDQIGYLVRALLGLRRVPAPDAADALAIAICHARLRQLPGEKEAAL